MSPRLVLAALTWTRDKDPRVPLGHASLLAALHAAEVDTVSVCHAVNAPDRDLDALSAELVREAGPRGDIAIGVYVWNEREVQALLPRLRAFGHRGRVILGGPQISYAEAGVAALYPDADVFVRGYGEEALVALMRTPDAPHLPGVTRRGEPDHATQARPDLDALPSPWRSGVVPTAPFVRMETQRGCPFRCSFCQHREAGGRLTRVDLGLDRVLGELDLFCERGVEEIAILDPIFNAGRHAGTVLGRLRERGYGGRVTLQCRYEMVNEAFLDACAGLDVVLEFGLQTIHPAEARVVQRGNDLAKVDAAVRAVRARGLRSEVSLIFGLPEQTFASFRASVDWCLARGIPRVRAFPLMLLRGTPLARDRARWGLVESDDAIPMVIASHTFDAEDWARMGALSEALRATEGRHPVSVDALEAFATGLDRPRFSPA